MVQTFDNQLNEEEVMKKNTSSLPSLCTLSTSTVAVVSDDELMMDNNNPHQHQTNLLLSTTTTTTENSKIHDCSCSTTVRELTTTTTTTTQQEQHERALSIVHELIREGKLNSSKSATHASDINTSKKDCKTLAQLMNETDNSLISPSFLLVIVFKTVRLLDLLHKHHLIHRNLTCENILIEKMTDGNLNVHLNNLDKSIELFLVDDDNVNEEEHAGKKTSHKNFNYNRNIETVHQPPETFSEKPFICLKSEIWSLAVCILRVLFRKTINIHLQEDYVEQLDELFGKDSEEDTLQDETSTIMTCLKEMTRNMLRVDVNERWSCADVIEYICLASTFLKSVTPEVLNQ